MNINAACRALAALAQPRRLRIFRYLVSAGRGGATPKELLSAANVANATLSFHLRELADAKLITAERQGRHRVYRASFAEISALLAYLADDCCRGQSCELTVSKVEK